MKLVSSKQNRRIANLAGELLGPAFTADTGEWGTYSWSQYLCSTPGLRIAGGTDEIQHNILGERVLTPALRTALMRRLLGATAR